MKVLPPLFFRIGSFFILIEILCFCSQPEREIRRVQFLMGTKVEIIAQGKNELQLDQAVDKGFKEFERLEAKLSRYQPESVISRINQNAGVSPVQVDDEVLMLIEKSLEICRESEGAFDITILPLLLLWRFDKDNPRPPSEKEVNEKLKLVGCQKIILDKNNITVFLAEPGMGIDLGGIAKGYAVDCVVRILKENGVSAGIVNAGGDLRVFGGKGKGMAIGIQNPRESGKILGKIYLREGALATSGDYERFYIFNGVRYSHLINPKTGYPVSGMASVSVKAESGMMADAWATALFVLGTTQGLRILKSEPELEALFIEDSGASEATAWFEKNLIWLKEN